MTEPLFAVLVCVLAAHRLQRIVTADSLTYAFRVWAAKRAYPDPIAAEAAVITAEIHGQPAPAPTTARRKAWEWFYALISCAFCLGWWTSLGCYAAWTHYPSWRPYLVAVAVAGGQAVLAAKAP